MKIKQITIILFLLLGYSSIAQLVTNYDRGFKIGFKEGYCYNSTSVSCFTPLTPLVPLPRINENKENYTDGYNRGFQFGLDLKRSKVAMEISDNNVNVSPKFNNYVSQNPVEAMRMVGMYKQQKYDARTNWTQERIYQLGDLIKNLFNSKNLPSYDIEETRNIYHVKLRNYANSLSAVDFADDYQFRNVVNGFSSLENNFYVSYNSCVKSENRIKLEREAKESSKKQNESNNTNTAVFNSFLNKEAGTYACSIFLFKRNKGDKKYYSEESYNGLIRINSNKCIDFKDDSSDWRSRCLLNQKINSNEYYKYNYQSEFGDVIVDKYTSEFLFYDEGKTCYYKYVIKNKVEGQKDDEHKFSSNFLAKNKGEYCCEVSFFKWENNKYIKTLTRNGYLEMDADSMIFLDNLNDCNGDIAMTLEENTMVFEDEVFDKHKLEFSYYSKTVVIDSNFKNITIYSSDKKTARVFKIIRKREN